MNSSPAPAFPKAEIEAEQAIADECHSFMMAKSPGLMSDRETTFASDDFIHIFEQLIADGKSEAEAQRELTTLVRAYAANSVERCRQIVVERLEKIEKVYFKKLLKYGEKYGLTADAKSEFDVRRMRTALLDDHSGVNACLENPDCTIEDWKLAIASYRKKIDDVAKLASELSKQKLEWEKLIDDKSRLRAAVRGLWLAVALAAASLSYDVHKDCGSANPPAVCAIAKLGK